MVTMAPASSTKKAKLPGVGRMAPTVRTTVVSSTSVPTTATGLPAGPTGSAKVTPTSGGETNR